MPVSAATAPRKEHGTTRVDGEERRPNILCGRELARCRSYDEPGGKEMVVVVLLLFRQIPNW